MNDATDVLRAIDQLRRDLSGYYDQLVAHSDLQRHCDNQRKRIAELEGLYAKAKEEIVGLATENVKLRRLVRDMCKGMDVSHQLAHIKNRAVGLGVKVDA